MGRTVTTEELFGTKKQTGISTEELFGKQKGVSTEDLFKKVEQPSFISKINTGLDTAIGNLGEQFGKTFLAQKPITPRKTIQPVILGAGAIPTEQPKLTWTPPGTQARVPEIRAPLPIETFTDLTPGQEKQLSESYSKLAEEKFKKKTEVDIGLRKHLGKDEGIMFIGSLASIGKLVNAAFNTAKITTPIFATWAAKNPIKLKLIAEAIKGGIAGVTSKKPNMPISQAAVEGAVANVAGSIANEIAGGFAGAAAKRIGTRFEPEIQLPRKPAEVIETPISGTGTTRPSLELAAKPTGAPESIKIPGIAIPATGVKPVIQPTVAATPKFGEGNPFYMEIPMETKPVLNPEELATAKKELYGIGDELAKQHKIEYQPTPGRTSPGINVVIKDTKQVPEILKSLQGKAIGEPMITGNIYGDLGYEMTRQKVALGKGEGAIEIWTEKGLANKAKIDKFNADFYLYPDINKAPEVTRKNWLEMKEKLTKAQDNYFAEVKVRASASEMRLAESRSLNEPTNLTQPVSLEKTSGIPPERMGSKSSTLPSGNKEYLKSVPITSPPDISIQNKSALVKGGTPVSVIPKKTLTTEELLGKAYPGLPVPRDYGYHGIWNDIKARGGIRPYKPDMYGKVSLHEEYKTTVPIHLRNKSGKPLDEMAQELFDAHILPEPSETALLDALDRAKWSRRNNIAAIIRESPTMEQANKDIINEIGINIPVQILKKYEIQYKGGPGPELTNEISNDLANEIKLEEIVPRRVSPKAMINRTTGIKNQAEIKNISEDVLLRKQIRDEARGAKEGFTAGAKQTKEQMIEKFKAGAADRQMVVDYIRENLPQEMHGRFINALRDVGDIKKQFGIFARVDAVKEEIERKALLGQVEKLIRPRGFMAVDYQKKLQTLRLDIDLKTPTEATINKLKSLAEFIKKNGEPMGIAPERLASLQRLSKKPLKQMTRDELSELKDNLDMVNRLGKLKLQLKNKYNERERFVNLHKLLDSSNNIDPKISGNEKIDKAKFETKQFFFKTLHTPRVADAIDGYKLYKGENAKYVKQLGAGEIKAKTEAQNKLVTLIEKIKAIKPEWTEAEQRDVVILLHYEQRAFDQAETLMQLHGLRELPVKTPEYAQVMDIIRSGLNNADRIAPIYEETTNKIFKKIDNYFPIKYEKEFNMLPEDMINQERHRTTKTFQGFTKERVKGVQRIPRTDLFAILDDTVNEQEWYINLQPELENIKYLVKDPEYKAKAGEIADDFWRNELDIVSRRGWSATAKNNFLLKQARVNLNTAVLGFRVSTLLLQPTAVFDAIALAQVDYGTPAAIEITKEFAKTWLNPWYAKRVISESPALRLRQGGELGMEETFQQSKTNKMIDRLRRLSMWGIQKTDVLTAASAQRGIENILIKNGIPNAKEESEFFMNMSQASSDAAYRPQILATGEFARTIFTFQTFVLNRWGIILNDIARTGYHNPTIKKSINALIALAALVGAQIAEQMARQNVKQVLSPNSKQKPDSLLKTSLLAVPSLVPYFGSMFQAATHGYDTDPAAVRAVQDIFKGGYNTFKPGKEHATLKERKKEDMVRMRGALTATGSLVGLLTGFPGASQGTEILKQFTYDNKR